MCVPILGYRSREDLLQVDIPVAGLSQSDRWHLIEDELNSATGQLRTMRKRCSAKMDR